MSFSYFLPTKIVFGKPAGEALAEELATLQLQRVLWISDPILVQLGTVERAQSELNNGQITIVHSSKISSTPTIHEISASLAMARQNKVQAIIALGGGSVIDVAKAVAMLVTNGGEFGEYMSGSKPIGRRSLPLLAIPTTAGTGSEVSRTIVALNSEEASPGMELSHPLMFPSVALLDPELTRSLPSTMTAATGMNAFTQAMEAYLSPEANPFTDQLASTAMSTAWTFLPRVTADSEDMSAREAMMLAATWGGVAVDQVGAGLVHALSMSLATHLHLHYGLANAMILPHAARIILPAIPAVRHQRLSRSLGLAADTESDAVVERLAQFIHFLGLPTRLSQLDTPLAGFDWNAIAEEAAQSNHLTNNHQSVSAADCRVILKQLRDGSNGMNQP